MFTLLWRAILMISYSLTPIVKRSKLIAGAAQAIAQLIDHSKRVLRPMETRRSKIRTRNTLIVNKK